MHKPPRYRLHHQVQLFQTFLKLNSGDTGFDFQGGLYSADHPGEDESGFTFGGTASTEQMKKFGIATNLAAASNQFSYRL